MLSKFILLSCVTACLSINLAAESVTLEPYTISPFEPSFLSEIKKIPENKPIRELRIKSDFAEIGQELSILEMKVFRKLESLEIITSCENASEDFFRSLRFLGNLKKMSVGMAFRDNDFASFPKLALLQEVRILYPSPKLSLAGFSREKLPLLKQVGLPSSYKISANLKIEAKRLGVELYSFAD